MTTATLEATEANAEVQTNELLQANQIVRNNVLWAAAAGLVPVPFYDVAAITLVQVKLLKNLSDIYNVTFSENLVKNLVTSLLAGIGTPALARGMLGSLIKSIPVVGTVLGSVAQPIFAGAITFAVGRVFITHFESGGTFLDFDPAAVREHFAQAYEEGKKEAEEATKSAKK
jgi:uncharacterized protein (DUF697 family)